MPKSSAENTAPAPLPAKAPKKFFTLKEIAERWGVTKMVVRQEIKRGRLEAIRIGYRKIRVSDDAEEKYLRERAREGVVV